MKRNIFSVPVSPPRARTLYLVALGVAILISAFAAYSFDVFQGELLDADKTKKFPNIDRICPLPPKPLP